MSLEFLNRDTSDVSELDNNLSTSKRKEVRQRVLFRGLLYIVDQQVDVQVTDLSRRGLRGTTDGILREAQRVFVSLDDITHCAGTVRWAQGRRFGMKFDKLLNVLPDDLPTDVGTEPDHQPRMGRIATSFNAKIATSNMSCVASIRNISRSGMMVTTDMPLCERQQLIVELSNGKIVTANVRWVEGDQVGVELSSPLSILQLTYGGLR